jgi:hypothetical protein
MKAALAGQQFSGPEDLLTGIQKFMSKIQRFKLELVLHHWIERAQWVLDNDGDYRGKEIPRPPCCLQAHSISLTNRIDSSSHQDSDLGADGSKARDTCTRRRFHRCFASTIEL